MRKLSAIPLVIVIAFMLMSALPVMADPVEKITICHAAGLVGTTQYVTLHLPPQAVFGQAGHFNENGTPQAGHEQDYMGECEEEETSTTNTRPTTSSTTTTTITTTTEATAPSSTTSTTETITTATVPSSIAPSTTAPRTTTTSPELPFTGISDVGELALLGVALLGLGWAVVRAGQKHEDRLD